MNDREKMIKDAGIVLAIIKYLLIFGIIALFVYYGAVVLVVLLPFVVGLILAKTAYNLSRLWNTLIEKIRKSRRFGKFFPRRIPGLAPAGRDSRAAGIFYILIVILLVAALAGLVAVTVSQIRSIAAYIPTIIDDTTFITDFTNFIGSLSGRFGGLLNQDIIDMIRNGLTDLQSKIIDTLPAIASAVLNWFGRMLANLPAIIIALVVIFMSGYYFVADSRSIYKFMYRNVRNRHFVRRTFKLINALSTTLFRVIGGYILLLAITFIEAFVGFTIIGMPYAVVLSVVAAIVDFLPLLGISATMVPVIIYMFAQGRVFSAIGAIIMLVVISVVRRFIEPPILGNAMRLHPMATLFSMILGVSAYGLSGILIGPIVLVIVKEVFSQFGFDNQLRILLGKLLTHINIGQPPSA